MTPDIEEGTRRMIRYGWEEREDPFAYENPARVQPQLQVHAPQVIKAYADYVAAKAVMDAVIRDFAQG